MCFSTDVDITGVSVLGTNEVEMSVTPGPSRSLAYRSVNEHFATLAGDPFQSSSLEASETDSSSDNDSEGEEFCQVVTR